MPDLDRAYAFCAAVNGSCTCASRGRFACERVETLIAHGITVEQELARERIGELHGPVGSGLLVFPSQWAAKQVLARA